MIIDGVFCKPLPFFPDYMVSEDGRIRGMYGNKWMSYYDNGGYHKYTLRGRIVYAQVAVYCAFIDPTYRPNKGFVIDHIDGNPHNNTPQNLRKISHRENLSKERTHKSGTPVGVCWHPKRKSYLAKIRDGYDQINLGWWKDVENAAEIYRRARTIIESEGDNPLLEKRFRLEFVRRTREELEKL